MENDGADSSKSPKVETEIINIESSEDEDIVLLEHHHCSPKTSPCKVSRKTSTSGKAFGGHASSSQVRASNEEQTPAVKKSPNPKRSLDTLSRSSIGCNICGKKFRSNKSLFGHMRCHPDRGYRGMEPPLKLDQTIDAASDSKEEDHSGGRVLAPSCDPDKSLGSDELLKGGSVRSKRGPQPVTINDDPFGVSDLNSTCMFEVWMKLLKFVSRDSSDKKAKVCVKSDGVRMKDRNGGESSNALTNQKVDTIGKGKEKMVHCNDIVDEDGDEHCEIPIFEQGCKSCKEGTSRNFSNMDKAAENVQNGLETQEKMEEEEEEEEREEETREVDDSKICEETNGVVLSSDDRKGGDDGDDEPYVCDYCKEVLASGGEAHKCRFGSKFRFDLNEPYEPQDK